MLNRFRHLSYGFQIKININYTYVARIITDAVKISRFSISQTFIHGITQISLSSRIIQKTRFIYFQTSQAESAYRLSRI